MAEEADTDPVAETTHTIENLKAKGESSTNSKNVSAESAIQKSFRTSRAPREWCKNHSLSMAKTPDELFSFSHVTKEENKRV